MIEVEVKTGEVSQVAKDHYQYLYFRPTSTVASPKIESDVFEYASYYSFLCTQECSKNSMDLSCSFFGGQISSRNGAHPAKDSVRLIRSPYFFGFPSFRQELELFRGKKKLFAVRSSKSAWIQNGTWEEDSIVLQNLPFALKRRQL